MRIKSYFAPSVQSAISIARREFGDEVTLVTSHTSSLESRHLGDYEVVFAVDDAAAAESQPATPAPAAKSTQVIKAAAATVVLEPERAPAPVAAAAPAAFEQVFQEAITTPLSTEQDVPEKLDRVHTLLVEMGIDAPAVRALMTMIERMTPTGARPASEEEAAIADIANEDAAVDEINHNHEEPASSAVPPIPDLTPAELAFYLSVSVGS